MKEEAKEKWRLASELDSENIEIKTKIEKGIE
jgi:hypothetical protein